jgi:phospholipid/cholesterol/gamma-HCH transport system substrate-binding protein
MLFKLDQVMGKINTGEGSLGLLVNDPALYTNLNKVAVDLDIILKDLNKHPAKYIPIPFTKKQRKKAMEASQISTP